MATVRRVETPADWKQFWGVLPGPVSAWSLPPFWDVNANPFFRHADLFPFLAVDGEHAVGRVAVVMDAQATATTGNLHALHAQTPEAANALLKHLTAWAKGRGLTHLRGPQEGIPPEPLMQDALQQQGFRREQAVYHYTGDHAHLRFSDPVLAQAERIRQRSAFSLRPLKLNHRPEEELELLGEIYASGWGLPHPPALEELRFLYQQWKPRLDPELSWIIQHRGQPVGFSLAFGDGNRWLPRTLRKRWQRGATLHLPLLGFRQEYRHYALGPWIYTEYLNRAPAQGYLAVEAGPVLEEHHAMVSALEALGLKRAQTRHLYAKELSR